MLKNQRKDTYQPRGRSLQLPPSCRFPPLREGNRARVRFPLLSGGTLRRGFSFIRTFVNSGSAIGITTRQPTTTQQPRKTTLHQPTTRQHHKTLPLTKHARQRHTKLTQQPLQQTLLVIRPIRNHNLRRRMPTQHILQHHTRPTRVRHSRRRHPHPKHTALRVHHDMPSQVCLVGFSRDGLLMRQDIR